MQKNSGGTAACTDLSISIAIDVHMPLPSESFEELERGTLIRVHSTYLFTVLPFRTSSHGVWTCKQYRSSCGVVAVVVAVSAEVKGQVVLHRMDNAAPRQKTLPSPAKLSAV